MIESEHAMLEHDNECIYNPVALREPELDVINYGHDEGHKAADEFHSLLPMTGYVDGEIVHFENEDMHPFEFEIEDLNEGKHDDGYVEGHHDEHDDEHPEPLWKSHEL